MGDYNIDVELDCKGMFCPMPIVKLKKTTKTMESGQILKMEATDPGSKKDVPAWARRTGNEILETVEDEDVLTFIIKVN